ncbi:MAG: Hsp70 family protein [Sulfuricaulis sp.]
MKVGIDFGTTTSTICRLLPDGRLDTQGPIPSIGAWKNGSFFFGREAEQLLASDELSAYPVRNLKLALGNADLRIQGIQIPAVKAVEELLRYLAVRIAKDAPIEEAVIGTPVRVSFDHRRALLDAAAAAGFQTTRLVYEPTSALVGAENIERMDSRSSVLVVDWGGGTLDIAVLRKEGNLLREIEVDGDIATLGGARMDDELVRIILEKRPDVRRKVDAIEGGHERLKHEIEGTKIEILSAGFEDDEQESRHIVPRWLREDIEIRPSDVFAVIRKLAEQAQERIVKFLVSARINASEITHLLFAGGVCNSPIVKEVISSAFPFAQRIDTLKPQLLTAIGSARLIQHGFSLQLSSSFGVRQCDDTFCEMLPSGQNLGVGAFRTADFMVTDVLAAEAVFDLGIRRENAGAMDMMSAPIDGFRSLGQLYVSVQEKQGQNMGRLYDLVRLYCSVDASLAVTAYVESNLTGKSAKCTLSGIPLCVRIGA